MLYSALRPIYSGGIDLGGTSTRLALVSPDGRMLAHARIAAVAGEPPQSLFARLRPLLEQLAGEAQLPYPPPDGIGIGVAGIVDHRTGSVRLAGALELADCELRGPAESALQCPVAVECDSNAGALADLYWGQARQATNLLYISWGTGIGAGLALGRRLYRSSGGAMGEFGHTPVGHAGTRLCYCGCRGCLEVEAGGRALALQAGVSGVEEMAASAAAGDAHCRKLLERAAILMGRAVAGALALLNPDCVVFGGGVSRAMPVMREAFDGELARRAPAFARRGVKIAVSDFGDNAGVLGAALLPLHRREEEYAAANGRS